MNGREVHQLHAFQRVNTKGIFRGIVSEADGRASIQIRLTLLFKWIAPVKELARRNDDPAALRGMASGNGLLKSFCAIGVLLSRRRQTW